MKYSLDAKLIPLHGAALIAAGKKDPTLANSNCDILQKRLHMEAGQDYEREEDAKSFDQILHMVMTSWRRMVTKQEGDDKLTLDDIKSRMALDITMYQNRAMRARLPYQLREDPEDSDDDPPIELLYRVVIKSQLGRGVRRGNSTQNHALSSCARLIRLVSRCLLSTTTRDDFAASQGPVWRCEAAEDGV